MHDQIKQALDSKTALKAYKDLASTPLKESSKFITDIIKTLRVTVGASFQLGAALQDKYENFLKETIRKVPEEDRIIPVNSIILTILQNITYLEEKMETI